MLEKASVLDGEYRPHQRHWNLVERHFTPLFGGVAVQAGNRHRFEERIDHRITGLIDDTDDAPVTVEPKTQQPARFAMGRVLENMKADIEVAPLRVEVVFATARGRR